MFAGCLIIYTIYLPNYTNYQILNIETTYFLMFTEQKKELISVGQQLIFSQDLKMALPTKEGYDYVSIMDIIYFQTSGNYSIITLIDLKYLNVCRPLKYFEATLTSRGFVRIHNEFLINLKHLTKYNKINGGEVVMSDGKILEVSRGKKVEFLKIIRESL